MLSDDNLQWFELMPSGWECLKKPLIEELSAAVESAGEAETFEIYDLKEKWFSLRIYHNSNSPEVEAVIRKYEKLSAQICLACGAARPCQKHPYF